MSSERVPDRGSRHFSAAESRGSFAYNRSGKPVRASSAAAKTVEVFSASRRVIAVEGCVRFTGSACFSSSTAWFTARAVSAM